MVVSDVSPRNNGSVCILGHMILHSCFNFGPASIKEAPYVSFINKHYKRTAFRPEKMIIALSILEQIRVSGMLPTPIFADNDGAKTIIGFIV